MRMGASEATTRAAFWVLGMLIDIRSKDEGDDVEHFCGAPLYRG